MVSLLLGVVLTFGSLKVLSSQAETLSPSTTEETLPIKAPVEVSKIPISTNNNFVTAAINKTGAAVVRIDTEATVNTKIDPLMNDPFFRDFFGDRLGEIPQQKQVRGQGSGFITDKNGTILTNAHVVSQADKVTVLLKDGRKFQGVVKGIDEVTDLAVVKIEGQGANLPVAPLGDSSGVQVGDWAIAVGNPIGLNNTVTLGIISTLQRSSSQVGIPDKRVEFLQTDAAINPGNSGGPLLNEKGEVIGINTAIRADANGIGFAIPINKAKSLQSTLAAGKKVAHPFVGIQMVTLTPELAKENNQDPNSAITLPEIEGVLVMKVLPKTPAEKAGIRRGDVIVQINQQKVTSADRLQGIVENSGIDTTLKMKIQRNGKVIDLEVTTAQMTNAS